MLRCAGYRLENHVLQRIYVLILVNIYGIILPCHVVSNIGKLAVLNKTLVGISFDISIGKGTATAFFLKEEAVQLDLKAMKDTDKARANYYAYHTGRKWGDPVNYHFSLDSGYLEIEDIVDLIIEYSNRQIRRATTIWDK